MAESKDYRLYLEANFKDLRNQIAGMTTFVSAQFKDTHERLDKIDEKVDKIETQTTLTNSRVTKLEDEFKEEKEYVSKEIEWGHKIVEDRPTACPNLNLMMDCKDKLNTINTDLEEYRLIKKHPIIAGIIIAVFVIGMLVSAYGTFRTMDSQKTNKEIIEKIDKLEKEVLK